MKRPHRVLVVDDQQIWRETLRKALQGHGCLVDLAESTSEALEALEHNFYHLLVVDIRLVDADETNTEGMELLNELSRRGLTGGVEVIMLSAYGTMDQMRESFTQYDVADFASKNNFLDVDFLKQVDKVFTTRVEVNLDLRIDWEKGYEPKQLVVGVLLGKDRVKRDTDLQALAATELEDLLCRLFSNANHLFVSSLSTGQSGASVLWSQPFYDTGGARPVVVKFGDFRSIDGEYQNFHKYVQPFITGGRSTSIPNGGLQRTVRLGGIIYTLLGADVNQLQSFGRFYGRSEATEIIRVLDQLFTDTCSAWYSSPGRSQPLNLTEDYQRLLGFTIEKLEADLSNLKSVQGKHKLKFNSLGDERNFTNPLFEMHEQKFIKSSYVTITHGDFNETNILVDDSGHTWLIDFGRTGMGHILRDVAELDSVVRYKLLAAGDATLEERLRLEEALCNTRHFRELDKLASSFKTDNPAVEKAFLVTLHLRRIAQKIVPPQPNDDMGEYYIALLYNAVNTLRFYSLDPIQRQHSLLSASLLTDQLAQASRLL